MKIPLVMLMMVSLATVTGAQQSSSTPQPPSTATHPSTSAATSDADFVTKTAQVGIAEVQLGKLALQKSMGKDAEVTAWAAKTLPTIEAHLKEAETTHRAGSTH